MARIQTSSIISDIRGSIGGVTFQGGPHGLVAHAKRFAPNPNTIRQSQTRNYLQTLNNLWLSITQEQRDEWQTWADFQGFKVHNFSETSFYGRQAFFRVNYYMLFLGLGPIIEPFFETSELFFSNIDLSYDNEYLIAAVSGVPTGLPYVPLLTISRPCSPTINHFPAQRIMCRPTQLGTDLFDVFNDYFSFTGYKFEHPPTVFVNAFLFNTRNGTFSIAVDFKTTINTSQHPT